MHDLFRPVLEWYMENINYLTVILLMTVESSFIPFPSEVVIPPAAWKAAQGELDLVLIILASLAGSIIGALVNYWLGYSLGRKVIYALADTKIAHLLLINRASVEKAEQYFIKYGRSSTFIGRLVPGVRQLISIPAGMARMKMGDFLVFTILGSGLWSAVLALLGMLLYSQKALLERYYQLISNSLLAAGALFFLYLVYRAFKPRRKPG